MKTLSSSVIISIITPTFNSKKFIKNFLNHISGFNENYFEFIIIDDGSTDQTYQILKRENNLKNCRIYKLKKNKGPGIARNFGVLKAKGKYLLFLDIDDFLIKKNTIKLNKFANNENSNLIFFTFFLIFFCHLKSSLASSIKMILFFVIAGSFRKILESST